MLSSHCNRVIYLGNEINASAIFAIVLYASCIVLGSIHAHSRMSHVLEQRPKANVDNAFSLTALIPIAGNAAL